MPDLGGDRVLVTGAGGFIGSAVVRALLREGAEVHAAIRPGSAAPRLDAVRGDVRIAQADVADPEQVRALFDRIRPAIVLHLAAGGVTAHDADPGVLLAANVLGTYHVLTEASRTGFRCFVHVGGSSEYGPRDHPLREEDEPRPITHYGASKAAATILARRHARATGENVVVVRPFSVYGPREAPSRLVPTAIAAGLSGRALPLTSPGIARDWVHVDDVAEACVAAAVAGLAPGTVLNVATGVQHANEEVVAEIGHALGTEIRVEAGAFPSRTSDTTCWVADTTAARALLGWKARHGLRSGIADTVSWHLSGTGS